MTKENKDMTIDAWDPEYNKLTKTLKITLVLDEAAILSIVKTSPSLEPSPTNVVTPQHVTNQVVELLERSIHLNTPSPLRFGRHDRRTND